MKNILVFPCGSEIGLEVNRSLANSIHFNLFGASSVSDHGRYVYKNYIDGLPTIDATDFIDELNKVIKEYKIDFIVPAHDSVVLKLAEYAEIVKAEIISSSFETCFVCRSKGKTYQKFKEIIPVPKSFNGLVEEFPVFLKPDVGQGSKGTYKANTQEEVDYYLEKDKSLLVLEYLPGPEFTIDCFTNKKGELLFAEGRIRNRISNGISVNSKQVINEKFREIAEIINSHLAFRGCWFFQLKEDKNGELALLEIAPRVAGTMSLFRMSGVNFIQLSIFDRMGYDVKINYSPAQFEVDRALFSRYSSSLKYQTVYLDFDDTIVINGKINTSIISYMYQMLNQNKNLVLITKHEKNIEETLASFHISKSMFSKIIHLKKSDKKSDFIEELDSIFIDDSFAERADVLSNKGIPVFAVDAVEALIDWKN